MGQNNSKNYLDWFKKANDDERDILSILKHKEGTAGLVCFLSQQMAEKYLKALLVHYSKPFPKIHDLIELETLLLEKSSDVNELHNDLKILNRYYIETRYPGDYPEFSWKDAKEAYTAAKKTKEVVLKKIS